MPSEDFYEVLGAAGQIAKLTEQSNRNMEQIFAASERLMAPMRAITAS